jgi:myo-inositol catabolism protein IolC
MSHFEASRNTKWRVQLPFPESLLEISSQCREFLDNMLPGMHSTSRTSLYKFGILVRRAYHHLSGSVSLNGLGMLVSLKYSASSLVNVSGPFCWLCLPKKLNFTGEPEGTCSDRWAHRSQSGTPLS